MAKCDECGATLCTKCECCKECDECSCGDYSTSKDKVEHVARRSESRHPTEMSLDIKKSE